MKSTLSKSGDVRFYDIFPLVSVYTKTGDKGETGLVSSDPKKPVRVLKSSEKIEVIGTIDELNSFLGIVVSNLEDKKLHTILKEIQRNLFTIGAIVAGSKLKFLASKTKKLEKRIDEWERSLPVLKNFILAGGSKEGALVFYARALARKTERRLVLLSKTEKVNPEVLKYFNRLSDYLFVLVRFINSSKKTAEDIWKPLKSSKR